MVDDRSTAVSLPEVPLLGVLPGTGGLTRVIDKRKVRRDVPTCSAPTPTACVPSARRPGSWSTGSRRPSEFAALVRERAAAHVAASSRALTRAVSRCVRSHAPSTPAAITTPRRRRIRPRRAQRDDRRARPAEPQPQDADAIVAAGDAWWPLTLAREFGRRDPDACARTSPNSDCWLLRTEGDPDAVLAVGPRAARAARSLAGSRDDRLAAPHARAARRHLTQLVCDRRRRLVLSQARSQLATGRQNRHVPCSRCRCCRAMHPRSC